MATKAFSIYYGPGNILDQINAAVDAAALIGPTGIGTISGSSLYAQVPSAMGLMAMLLAS